ncbi:MAG: queuosine precursor transporter, partial [Patescibacteria group bacterium]
NSFIMAKLKIKTKGKFLWLRTITSTIFGEGLDTTLFVVVAFWGVLPPELLWSVIVSNYIFKVLVEVGFTPITYLIVGFLKKREHEDYYDYKTDFNPFSLARKSN